MISSNDPYKPLITNVLFILADDMGAWALGCAGNSEVRTPNLDQLSARGIMLCNAFCTSPVCSPARASILTGRIPSQHGIHDWIRQGNSPRESPNGTVTDYLSDVPAYTEILAEQGYTCGLSGKWHLGNATSSQKGHTFWKTYTSGGSNYYGAPMLGEDGEEYDDPRYVTHVITENALEFLNQQERGAQPFYLGVHYTAPHSPWDRGQHPPEYFDAYVQNCAFQSTPERPPHICQIKTAPCPDSPERRRELLSGYYAAITAMDADIGRLLQTLDDRDLTDTTLIIFTGDNGMNMGHHGLYGKGNATYPLNMYDTSVRVPFIASCPGKIPEGAVAHSLFSHYDFMPSLLDFLGLRQHIPRGLPGKSCADLWQEGDTSAAGGDNIVVYDEYGPVRMIRTLARKYVHHFTSASHEFYDLLNDPDEEHNLINSAEYANEILELRSRLQSWFAQHVDPLQDGSILPVTGMGQLSKATRERVSQFQQGYKYSNPV
ncbi:MAG: sulfatase-like hydrolase/transferase [Candidatus Methylacidiphilales bacterium]|nr:sulfatase-like hydrolase/transferase [Candidatus Methylacidiphilales bacterium]